MDTRPLHGPREGGKFCGGSFPLLAYFEVGQGPVGMYYYGGQAVIEGVMMRGQGQATVAMRAPSGEIVLHSEALPPSLYRSRLSRLPFVRGLVAVWEMLVLGTRMMLRSAAVQARMGTQQDVSRAGVTAMMAFALTFVVGVFFVFPLFVARAAGGHVHGTLAANALEGCIRLAMFLVYLWAIGRLHRMRRVFQYHGAEHKTINALEAGAGLDVQSVRHFSTIHVRCGTAFLLWVAVVSIFVFALIGHPPLVVGALLRVVLVPVIAAIGYEILRFAARFYHLLPVRLLVQPGLWLQRLTTREPSDDQLEIAIAALLPVLRSDGVAISGQERVDQQIEEAVT